MEIYCSFKIGPKENQLEILRDILSCLEASFLPKPKILWIRDKDEKPISSFIDSIILNEIEVWKKGSYIQVFNNLEDTSFIFSTNKNDNNISFNFRTQNEHVIQENSIRALFMDLLKICNPIYAEIDFGRIIQKMYREHYVKKRRTGFSPGLCWLQYYVGKELKMQGGREAIEKNPFIKTERIGEGLLVQVGESIYDSLTPEGEALLVKATEAMPPDSWESDI